MTASSHFPSTDVDPYRPFSQKFLRPGCGRSGFFLRFPPKDGATRPMAIWEATGARHGLGKKTGYLVGTDSAGVADIVNSTLEPDPKVVERYQHVVIHASLRRDGVNGDMDWYCPARA